MHIAKSIANSGTYNKEEYMVHSLQLAEDIMSEKMNKTPVGVVMLPKPVPMKLFATWEVDRTPSNCIPRLCTLTLSRLIILRQLGTDLASISIAVKMQSSKRILRSIELSLPPSGLLDTSLELSFSLQYPHFLKRDGNRLHVLLQRRKRYKNRTMLGFKTLAEGMIRMDQVLQKQMDLELELNADTTGKDKGVGPVARIKVLSLSSMPVDQEHSKTDRDRDFSDEEDEFSSGEEEVADLSDSEPLRGGGVGVGVGGSSVVGSGKMPALHGRHNLKQRFISLLRRFKVADTEGGRGAALANNTEIQALFQELESLSCDEESGGEQDTMSISSTPKPSLRPFFSSSRSLLDNNPHNTTSATDAMMMAASSAANDDRNCSGSDGNADLCGTDYEAQSDPQTGSPPRGSSAGEKVLLVPQHGRLRSDPDTSIADSIEKKTKLFRTSTSGTKKKHSLSVGSDTVICSTPESITPRKSFLDNLARLFPPDEPNLPDTIAFITGAEPLSSALCSRLTASSPSSPLSSSSCSPPPRIFQPISAAEVRAVMGTLLARVTKYCNTCGKPAMPVRLILIGGDTLVGWVLRPYVELLSGKPPDWVGFVRVYIVPLGSNISIARHVASADPGYASLFAINIDTIASASGTSSTPACSSSTADILKTADDLATRIQRYLAGGPSAPCAQLPLAEAMLTCHQDELIMQQLQQGFSGPTHMTGITQLPNTTQQPPSSGGAAQLFIPFVHEVRVGPADATHSVSSVDLEDLVGPLSGGSVGSGTASGAVVGAIGSGGVGQPPVTPPSSPNVQVRESPWEPLELQLDYWQLPGVKSGEKSDKATKSEGKTSFKGLFRGIQASPGLNVTMQIANKEKKQKIIRLGKKKEKEEAKAHCVESISRLICSAKTSNAIPMRVLIDGAEWNGVKFFQLNNTWQTHVKHLSVALTGVPLATSEP